MFLGFFWVEEGVHLIWVRAAQYYAWCVGGCQKGQFCFSFFSSHSLKQWSHEWMSSTHRTNRKLCLFFLLLSEFPALWSHRIPVLGWLTPELWGHWSCGRKPRVLLGWRDVLPDGCNPRSVTAMRCNSQWLPSSAMEKNYWKNIVLCKNKYRSYCGLQIP